MTNSKLFHNSSNGWPAADTQGGQSITLIAPVHLVNQGHNNASSRAAHGMTQTDAGSVGVDFCHIQFQLTINSQKLGGKSLVDFKISYLIQCKTGIFQHLGNS